MKRKYVYLYAVLHVISSALYVTTFYYVWCHNASATVLTQIHCECKLAYVGGVGEVCTKCVLRSTGDECVTQIQVHKHLQF